eukprot:PhF_6_TR578/c0_g1_i1/m.614
MSSFEYPPLPKEYAPGPSLPRHELNDMILEQKRLLDRLRIVPMKSSSQNAHPGVGAVPKHQQMQMQPEYHSHVDDAIVPPNGSALLQSLKLTLNIAKRYMSRHMQFSPEEDAIAAELYSLVAKRHQAKHLSLLKSAENDQHHPHNTNFHSSDGGGVGRIAKGSDDRSTIGGGGGNPTRRGLRLVQAIAAAPNLFMQLTNSNKSRQTFSSCAEHLSALPDNDPVDTMLRHLMAEVIQTLQVANCTFYIKDKTPVATPLSYIKYDYSTVTDLNGSNNGSIATNVLIERDSPHYYVISTKQYLNFTLAHGPKSFPEYKGSVLTCLRSGDDAWGVCHVTMKSNNASFSESDVQTLETLGHLAVCVLKHSHKLELVERELYNYKQMISYVKQSLLAVECQQEIVTATQDVCNALSKYGETKCVLNVPKEGEKLSTSGSNSTTTNNNIVVFSPTSPDVPSAVLNVSTTIQDDVFSRAIQELTQVIACVLFVCKKCNDFVANNKQQRFALSLMTTVQAIPLPEVELTEREVLKALHSLVKCEEAVLVRYGNNSKGVQEWLAKPRAEHPAVSIPASDIQGSVDIKSPWVTQLASICDIAHIDKVEVLELSAFTALVLFNFTAAITDAVKAFGKFAGVQLYNSGLLMYSVQAAKQSMNLLLGLKTVLPKNAENDQAYTVDPTARDRISGMVLDQRHKEAMLFKEFNIFNYWSPGRCDWLLPMMIRLLTQHGVLKIGNVSEATFLSFLLTLRKLYNGALPFNNFYRVIDAVHTACVILYDGQVGEQLQPYECYSVVIGILIQGAGVNQGGAEYTCTTPPVAIPQCASGTPSPDLLHSLTTANAMMSYNPEVNVLKSIAQDVGGAAHRMVADVVLAMDLTRFDRLLQMYTSACESPGGFNRRLAKHRKILYQMVSIIANWGFCAKSFDVSKLWAVGFEDESKKEKAKDKVSLDVEVVSDVLRKCSEAQCALLERYLIPALTSLSKQFVGTRHFLDNATANLATWKEHYKKRVEQEQQLAALETFV